MQPHKAALSLSVVVLSASPFFPRHTGRDAGQRVPEETMHLIPNLTIERRGCDSCATIHTLAVSLTPYYAYPNIACEQRYVVFTLISDVYSIKLGNPTSNPYAILLKLMVEIHSSMLPLTSNNF